MRVFRHTSISPFEKYKLEKTILVVSSWSFPFFPNFSFDQFYYQLSEVEVWRSTHTLPQTPQNLPPPKICLFAF